MKTREMTGPWLDYWVAKAECHEVDPPLSPGQPWPQRETFGRKYEPNYIAFSSDWQFGGPIIEREKISLTAPDPPDQAAYPAWLGNIARPEASWNAYGPTPLIAAMRAYVASKFGEDVPPE